VFGAGVPCHCQYTHASHSHTPHHTFAIAYAARPGAAFDSASSIACAGFDASPDTLGVNVTCWCGVGSTRTPWRGERGQ
jgi:hypothetical protein